MSRKHFWRKPSEVLPRIPAGEFTSLPLIFKVSGSKKEYPGYYHMNGWFYVNPHRSGLYMARGSDDPTTFVGWEKCKKVVAWRGE